MNPQLRSNLTMIGFPTTYDQLKDRMIRIDNENRQMDFYDPGDLDSRLLNNQGSKYTNQVIAFKQNKKSQPRQQYRVLGQTQPPPRVSFQDIMKMPPDERLRPNSSCYTCKGLNHPALHWRDECPYQRNGFHKPPQPIKAPIHPPPRTQGNNQRQPQASSSMHPHRPSGPNRRNPKRPVKGLPNR